MAFCCSNFVFFLLRTNLCRSRNREGNCQKERIDSCVQRNLLVLTSCGYPSLHIDVALEVACVDTVDIYGPNEDFLVPSASNG